MKKQLGNDIDLLDYKNPLILFSFGEGKEQKTCFGLMIEEHADFYINHKKIVVCVPRSFIAEFLQTSLQKKIEKIIGKPSVLSKIISFGNQNQKVTLKPGLIFEKDYKLEDGDESLTFVPILVKNDIPFLCVDEPKITDTLTMPCFFDKTTDGIVQLSTKRAVSLQREFFHPGVSLSILGSPVIDKTSKSIHSVVCEVRDGKFITWTFKEVMEEFSKFYHYKGEASTMMAT